MKSAHRLMHTANGTLPETASRLDRANRSAAGTSALSFASLSRHTSTPQIRFALFRNLSDIRVTASRRRPCFLPIRRLRLVLCQTLDLGWPGLEGGSPKPRGFLHFVQSSLGHPTLIRSIDRALAVKRSNQHADESPVVTIALEDRRLPLTS